jgi:putative ATP-dependent endonuclease of OLD family
MSGMVLHGQIWKTLTPERLRRINLGDDMRLISLRLKNFRSYGEGNSRESAHTLIFKEGINLVVGENNVGKSNILRSFEFITGSLQLDDTDRYCGNVENEVLLELEVLFADEELREFSRALSGERPREDPKVRMLMREFRRIHFILSSVTTQRVRIGDLYIQGNLIRPPPLATESGHTDVPWKQILENYYNTYGSSITAVIKNEIDKAKKPGICRVMLPIDLQLTLLGLLRQKLKVFSEVRQRPSGRNEGVLESYDGGLVADVLANLKMGTPQQRDSFELIKRKFNELFPNLRMEVNKATPSTPPRIVVRKETTDYEVSIDRVGAGIGEMIILLTHLMASKGMVFGLDMPELHFHPHAQRLLLEILRERSQNNQILVVTHSPILLEPKEIEKVTVVREQRGETACTQLPADYFTSEEKDRIERHLTTYNREFFFSRAALAVEGPTELGAMPVFSKALGKDFDTLGVSIIEAGKYFDIFVKLLNGLRFPFLVMCDRDVLMNIEKSIEINKRKTKTSAVFYNLSKIDLLKRKHKLKISKIETRIVKAKRKEKYDDNLYSELKAMAEEFGIFVLSSDFEGVLENAGYGELLKKAQSISESKVTCGRFVAQEIVKQNSKIPQEFIDVIASVAAKSTK